MMNARPPPSKTAAPTAASWRELRGVVERITYQNPENGYTVARLAPERAGPEADAARGDDRLVTVVGTLADLTPGEAIIARGWWRNDSKHGWQFMASDYRTTLPATSRASGSIWAAVSSRVSGRSTPDALSTPLARLRSKSSTPRLSG